jgi:hypothetical protein
MSQQKYLFIYRNSASAPQDQPSPQQMQAMMDAWNGWKNRFKANIVDVGDGLKTTGKVLRDGVLSDGPFVESKEILGGFSIVQADSYEQAIEVARACPFTRRPSYNIEIREMKGY